MATIPDGRGTAAVDVRGSAFGLLAAVQSFGNLAASAIAGLLWAPASPRVVFGSLSPGWSWPWLAAGRHRA